MLVSVIIVNHSFVRPQTLWLSGLGAPWKQQTILSKLACMGSLQGSCSLPRSEGTPGPLQSPGGLWRAAVLLNHRYVGYHRQK